MISFLNDIKNDKSIDCKNLGLKNVEAHKIIEILGGIYGISLDVLAADKAIKIDNILSKGNFGMPNTEGGGYIVIGRKDAGEAEDCSQEYANPLTL